MKWRVGRSLGRTLYLRTGGDDYKADQFVGMMDTREMASAVVRMMNDPHDQYHTLEELYEYRMLYNAAFANLAYEWSDEAPVVKSMWHSDGERCFGGGWFIVSMDLPTGQVSNHYELKYWGLFRIPEVSMAPEWDGHTPAEAAERLRRYCLGKDT